VYTGLLMVIYSVTGFPPHLSDYTILVDLEYTGRGSYLLFDLSNYFKRRNRSVRLPVVTMR
jgi:hypothetical protein